MSLGWASVGDVFVAGTTPGQRRPVASPARPRGARGDAVPEDRAQKKAKPVNRIQGNQAAPSDLRDHEPSRDD